MQHVTLSPVVRTHQPYRFLFPVQSWRQLMSFTLTLAIAVPVITVLLRLFDLSAPLAYTVVPAAIGSTASMFAVLPARLHIATSFHAQHLTARLDEAIRRLGYVRDGALSGAMRYHARHPRWLRVKENEIVVTVREHVIEIGGPVVALHALQKKMAG